MLLAAFTNLIKFWKILPISTLPFPFYHVGRKEERVRGYVRKENIGTPPLNLVRPLANDVGIVVVLQILKFYCAICDLKKSRMQYAEIVPQGIETEHFHKRIHCRSGHITVQYKHYIIVWGGSRVTLKFKNNSTAVSKRNQFLGGSLRLRNQKRIP